MEEVRVGHEQVIKLRLFRHLWLLDLGADSLGLLAHLDEVQVSYVLLGTDLVAELGCLYEVLQEWDVAFLQVQR